jgi:hypothetical protein
VFRGGKFPVKSQFPICNSEMPSTIGVWAVFFLFALCLVFPWAWFNTDLPIFPARAGNEGERIWLTVNTNLPGYTFVSVPLSPKELAILQTTNIVNGVFIPNGNSESEVGKQKTSNYDPSSLTSDSPSPASRLLSPISSLPTDSIRVFLASWLPQDGKKLTVLHHTPDICWVGAGWVPVDDDATNQLVLTIPNKDDVTASNKGIQLPFECRVFELPRSGHRERAAWRTLIDGKIMPEGKPVFFYGSENNNENTTSKNRMEANARNLGVNHLINTIKNRKSVAGIKQFVRCSVDGNKFIDGLSVFTNSWLLFNKISLSHG